MSRTYRATPYSTFGFNTSRGEKRARIKRHDDPIRTGGAFRKIEGMEWGHSNVPLYRGHRFYVRNFRRNSLRLVARSRKIFSVKLPANEIEWNQLIGQSQKNYGFAPLKRFRLSTHKQFSFVIGERRHPLSFKGPYAPGSKWALEFHFVKDYEWIFDSERFLWLLSNGISFTSPMNFCRHNCSKLAPNELQQIIDDSVSRRDIFERLKANDKAVLLNEKTQSKFPLEEEEIVLEDNRRHLYGRRESKDMLHLKRDMSHKRKQLKAKRSKKREEAALLKASSPRKPDPPSEPPTLE